MNHLNQFHHYQADISNLTKISHAKDQQVANCLFADSSEYDGGHGAHFIYGYVSTTTYQSFLGYWAIMTDTHVMRHLQSTM